MRQLHILVSAFAYLLMFFSATSHATLIGVLPATHGGTDWQAYYDDEADLTWLANANAGVGSVYDTIYPGTGRMSWSDANTLVAGLDINGVTGWRLPDTLQPDASCNLQSSGVSYGHNCTGSEMGNLFYNVLGGEAFRSIHTTHNSNYFLFSNIEVFYWSSTEYAPNPSAAWNLSFFDGYQTAIDKVAISSFAWAVQSGNAGASMVPVPAAVWLFGAGLLVLVGMGRHKKTA